MHGEEHASFFFSLRLMMSSLAERLKLRLFGFSAFLNSAVTTSLLYNCNQYRRQTYLAHPLAYSISVPPNNLLPQHNTSSLSSQWISIGNSGLSGLLPALAVILQESQKEAENTQYIRLPHMAINRWIYKVSSIIYTKSQIKKLIRFI
jgi:hypothetical protein